VWSVGRWSTARPQPKFTRLTYQQGYLSNARFAKDGQTVVYSAQWNNDPLHVYSVRTEFPQSTRVDLPSAALLTLSSSGDLELSVDPVYESWFMRGTMAQAQMAGGTPRAQEKDVIAADYAPDGKTLAVVRQANRKVQLEYPAGKVIYTTAGYLDYVRVSPSGKEVAFVEHPVYGDDRGWAVAVAKDGNRIAGRNASAQALVLDRETQKVQVIPGIELQETFQEWTEDGQALLVFSATPWEARIYRVEVATGKRTLLRTVEPGEKAGSILPMRLAYAEGSKTYAYSTVRILGTLYVAEGLE